MKRQLSRKSRRGRITTAIERAATWILAASWLLRVLARRARPTWR
ncbi:MAG TPA: hypothetical protein VFO81_05725 [Gaiellaceae bacterium]|nr:hypothetical protein [Gaiellaceae bacterium]